LSKKHGLAARYRHQHILIYSPKYEKTKHHEKEPTLTPPPPALTIGSARLAQLSGIGRFSGGQNVPAIAPVQAWFIITMYLNLEHE
jgi:hypothetical protein